LKNLSFLMKILLPLILFAGFITPVAAAEPAKPAPANPAAATTTEVRYVSAPPNRKGARVSKLIITRDANGKIISVKRG
jgi:hypothetical protein